MSGPRVTLEHRLYHPAVFGTGTAVPGTVAAESSFDTSHTLAEHPELAVAGPVDLLTVEQLRTRIMEAGRGGALPLILDLSEVTHLASVGVRLHDLTSAGDGLRIELRAPVGSTAHQVLTLTGLEHLVPTPEATPSSP